MNESFGGRSFHEFGLFARVSTCGVESTDDADAGKVAPEAVYLLTAAHLYLSLERADAILIDTPGAGLGS